MNTSTAYFETHNLSVGYNGRAIIRDINLSLHKGEILTLIGPNGSGKSTILKSITRHLQTLGGVVYIDNESISSMSYKKSARRMAVVLTDKVQPELMTCADVVGAGRYPYTGYFGTLTEQDHQVVNESLSRVHALDLRDKYFGSISDGQCQRIMLARAICQRPDVIVLDEPTSFLDIKHKIELLDILQDMAKTDAVTVIMSLHEIDLASKISDRVVCVKGETILHYGTPENIFKQEIINELYDIEKGSYNLLFGSVELSKPHGKPLIYVIAGGGYGVPIYRELQRLGIPFATGILWQNDLDYTLATDLATKINDQKSFCMISLEIFDNAVETMLSCKAVINAQTPIEDFNQTTALLLDIAVQNNKPIFLNAQEAARYVKSL